MRPAVRAPLTTLIAVLAVGFLVTSPPPFAILTKRIKQLGGRGYADLTVTGAFKKVLSDGGATKVQQLFAAVAAFVILSAFIVALVGAAKLLTGGREGAALWMSAVGGLLLIVAVTSMVL